MNENEIDTILRILICVLKECDDSCAIITCDVLPVIINIFKLSKYNQKNREKCLIIISLLLNKLSYADGNDYGINAQMYGVILSELCRDKDDISSVGLFEYRHLDNSIVK